MVLPLLAVACRTVVARAVVVIAILLGGTMAARAQPETAAPTATPGGIAVSQEQVQTAAAVHGKSPAAAHGVDRIWSGLVLATVSAKPKEPPPELREFVIRMKHVFGYNQFELAGSASTAIGDESESWLVPSQNFWLGVRARRTASKEARGGYLLNLKLYHDSRPLVDTEAKLAPGSPLFIRGPGYGSGHLIIVLQVQR